MFLHNSEENMQRIATTTGYLRTSEAAATLGVSKRTVNRMLDAGELRCVRTPGGHALIRREDAEAIRDGLRVAA